MIEFVTAFLGGAAANQLDDSLKMLGDGWELIARYICGVLVAEVFFVLMLRKLAPHSLRDGLLAFNGAFAGVGLGVVAARIGKDIISEKRRMNQ
jgi:hypothetical protein